MAAASADLQSFLTYGVPFQGPSYPMAVDIIYKNTMVAMDAGGELAPAQDVTGFSHVFGLATENRDNSAGSARSIDCQIQYPVIAKMDCTNASETTVGTWFYVVNDQTLGIASDTTYLRRGGIHIKYISATSGYFLFPGPQGIAAGGIAQSDLVAASLDGTAVKNTAANQVIGGIPVIHAITITAGALADTDVVLTHKTRITDCWLVLTGAGVSTTTLQVKNSANAISSLMAASGSDKDLVRSASTDDAYHTISAGGTLRVTSATGASQPGAIVYVAGFRIA